MKDVEDNNVYLALDDHKSDEFVLKQNLAVLIANKNATLESVAQEMGLYSRRAGADEMAKSSRNLCAAG